MAQKEIAVYGSNTLIKDTLIKEKSLRTESFWYALQTNPIIRKELRQRMRSWRGVSDLTLCTLYLLGFGLLHYSSNYSYRTYYTFNGYNPASTAQRSQELGTQYFLLIIIAQLLLLFLLNCKYSAGTVVHEKERQTYDVLLVSLLRPRDIVSGHLVAGVAYLLLITVAGWPVAFVAFLMGGISTELLIVTLFTVPFSFVMLAALGVFWSCTARTARRAGSNTLVNSGLLLFIVPFGLNFFIGNITGSFSGVPVYAVGWAGEIAIWLLSFNPIYVLLSCSQIFSGRLDSNLFLYATGQGNSLTPFVRFMFIAVVVSSVYCWLATRQIKPLQTESEKQQAIRAIKERLGRNGITTGSGR